MPSAAALSASVSLRKGAASPVGPERIALLEAILAHGSISGAAKAVGLSYKGAWDAVQAMNNLFERPVVAARAGGKHGGTALVTEEGVALISAFRAVEAELGHVIDRVQGRVSGDARQPLRTLLWSLGMKTSARNALRGVVDRVVPGAVNAEVVLKLGDGTEIVAVVTRDSVDDLGLAPGRPAIALIKSSFVILARDGGDLRTSARNKLGGVVSHVERGAVNDVVTLDIGGGKSITATVTRESAEDLGIEPGERIAALIKASHVILAVE
jgi:molybdate transport system regulatory protein